MKKYLTILLIFLIKISVAQNFNLVTDVSAHHLIPMGSLANRFSSTIGGSAFLGNSVNDKWIWGGNIEYFKFSKLNSEKLSIKRKIIVSGIEQEYQFSLPKLKMSLEVIGVSANAKVKLFKTDFIKSTFDFGFGIYRWFGKRSEYFDSIRVDTSYNNSGKFAIAEILQIPERNQLDWSGGFNAGINFNFELLNSFYLNTGVSYKIIIGELWPALKLDLENVSAFQIVDLHFGISYAIGIDVP